MSMTAETYGFIGIGHMGTPMASRLLATGKKVIVCDTNDEAVTALVRLGAGSARRPVDVANSVNCVFLSLPNPEIVTQVVLGDNGLSKGSKVRTIIDFSTIGPRAAIAIASELTDTGMTYADAPVSGGVPGARAGTLAVMVSCTGALFAEIEAVLKTFGKVFHVGNSVGQAQTVKLANNLLSASAIAVTSEVMVMGAKAGLDPAVMLDIINASSGRNSATQEKFPRSVLPGTFDFGFSTGLAYKDVRLCINEAEALGVPMLVGSAVREMLAVTDAIYGADSDYTSMCKVVESWGKATVRAKPEG